MGSEISRHMDFGIIRYAQVWEDDALLRRSLAIRQGDTVLSIASAGCNVFSLLQDDPGRIIAVDLSPAQLALCRLKAAALATLDHGEFFRFAGGGLDGTRGADAEGTPDGKWRAGVFKDKLRSLLPAEDVAYWEGNGPAIAMGHAHAGRLETYFRGFVGGHMPGVVDRARVMDFLDSPDLPTQRTAFKTLFEGDFKRAFVDYFGSRNLMRNGRDPAQFRFVTTGDVGEDLFGRFHHACTALPVRGNHYLEYFLLGGYRAPEMATPLYRREVQDVIRPRVGRVTYFHGPLEDAVRAAGTGSIQRANLSDVFEYLGEEDSDAILTTIFDAMPKGGRAVFWNLFVPRSLGTHSRLRAVRLPGESDAGLPNDRSWFYGGFHVCERA
jgi:S-adenosylmethionine-diacylglycerol 3-amino-3-carboxypropyl transferase